MQNRNNSSCILCNATSNQIVITENGYSGVKCPICGLIYISPKPSKNLIDSMYTEDKANISAQSHITNSYAGTIQARHSMAIIQKYKKSGSLLEIGAGAGYFAAEAKRQGFDVQTIELNPIQAKYIRQNLGISCKETLSDNEKFDIIYFSDVLSHFYDPIDEINKIKRCLNEQGLLVFETGNLGDVCEKRYKHFSKFQYPDHLFFFSDKSLHILLGDSEFEQIKMYRYNILPSLLFLNGISWDQKRNSNKTEKLPSVKKEESGIGNTAFKKIIIIGFCLIAHTLRYKIGRIFQHKSLPETVIIVAEKK